MLEGTLVLNYASVLCGKLCLIVFYSHIFVYNGISYSSFLIFFFLHQMTHTLSLFPLLSAALSSHFPFLTSHAENQNMGRMKVKGGVLVEWLTSNSSPRVFFFFIFFLVLLHWCRSTRLTECSKCSGSKKSTLLL